MIYSSVLKHKLVIIYMNMILEEYKFFYFEIKTTI